MEICVCSSWVFQSPSRLSTSKRWQMPLQLDGFSTRGDLDGPPEPEEQSAHHALLMSTARN